MARKTLLTEAEVRRFMKLANMGPVGDTRLQEMGYLGEQPEEEEAVAMDMGDEDMGLEVEDEVEDDVEDVGLEMGAEDVEGELDPELEDKLKAAIEAIAAEWGIEDSVSVEEAPGDEEEVGLEEPMGGEEVEAAMGPAPEGGGEELEFGAEEEVEAPVPGMRQYQEALVNKVARRVAARLMQENKNEELATQLTERIFKRITSK